MVYRWWSLGWLWRYSVLAWIAEAKNINPPFCDALSTDLVGIRSEEGAIGPAEKDIDRIS